MIDTGVLPQSLRQRVLCHMGFVTWFLLQALSCGVASWMDKQSVLSTSFKGKIGMWLNNIPTKKVIKDNSNYGTTSEQENGLVDTPCPALSYLTVTSYMWLLSTWNVA